MKNYYNIILSLTILSLMSVGWGQSEENNSGYYIGGVVVSESEYLEYLNNLTPNNYDDKHSDPFPRPRAPGAVLRNEPALNHGV